MPALISPEFVVALIATSLLFPVFRIYVLGNLLSGRLPEDKLHTWYDEEARKDRFGDFLTLLVELGIKLIRATKH